MKKIVIVLFCSLMVLSVFAGAQSAYAATEQETYRIVYVSKSLSNELFVLMGDGLKDTVDAVNTAAGYEKIIYEEQTTANESDIEQMLTLCDTLLTTDVDALVITPASSNSFADVVKKCNEQGIPFINMDTKVDAKELADVGAQYDVFIGTDNIQMGRDLFNSAVKAFNGSCKYIILGGYEGASTHIDMMQGLEEVAKTAPSTMVRLDYQPADWNRNKAFDIAGALLTAHPDVEAFICFNDQMASGAMQAIEAMGKQPGKDIKLFGSTFVGDAPQNIWDGKQIASVSRVPYETGQIAIQQVMRLLEGKPLEHPALKGNVIEIPGKPVTKDELELKDGVFYDKSGTPISKW